MRIELEGTYELEPSDADDLAEACGEEGSDTVEIVRQFLQDRVGRLGIDVDWAELVE